jgi:hypothetical protein
LVIVVRAARRVIGRTRIRSAPIIIFDCRIDCAGQTLSRRTARNRTDCGTCNHADRSANRTHGCTCRRAASCADTRSKVMVAELVTGLRIGDFARALTGETAGDCADGGSGDHANGPRDCAGGGTGERADARAGTLREIVFLATVRVVRVGNLRSTFSRETSSRSSNRCAGCHADGAACRSDCGAGKCATGRPHAASDGMLFRLTADGGIDRFSRRMASQSAGNGTDDGAGSGTDGTGSGADCSARQCATSGADTRSHRM